MYNGRRRDSLKAQGLRRDTPLQTVQYNNTAYTFKQSSLNEICKKQQQQKIPHYRYNNTTQQNNY